MPIHLGEIDGAIEEFEGIPHPNWNVIYDWISAQGYSDEEGAEACYQASLQWLDGLRRTLSPPYDIYESENFLLFSADEEERAMRLLAFAEKALEHVRFTLHGIASDEGVGKHVILAFHDLETYDRYFSRFLPEGHHADSAGVFIGEFYGHLILRPADEAALHSTIVHELAHACVRHLPLPLWLNEALAVQTEGSSSNLPFTPTDRVTADAEGMRALREHWRRHGLESFWSGEGFGSPEHQSFCYPLAQLLWGVILEKGKKPALDFVLAAGYEDAGKKAARDTLGESLDALVERIL